MKMDKLELPYSSEKHGTLEDYLSLAAETGSTPTFRRYDPYAKLWKEGYLELGKTLIRLRSHHLTQNEDESHVERTIDYIVRGEYAIEKVEGSKGYENPQKVLKRHIFEWEALNLASKPI